MRNTTLPELPTHPLIRDPRTGEPLRAVGIVGGRPVWPIMGASGPIPGGGQPPAAPPAPPAATPPAPNGQPAGQGATPEPPDEPLGEAGQRALAAERQFRAEAEARAKAAEEERDALKAATQTDQEKAVEAARAEGRAEGNQRLIRAVVEAKAAAAGFHDPADAAVQLHNRLAEVKVTKDGDVDQTKVTELVAELAQAKAYLVKTAGATPPVPLPGQGNHQPAPKSGAAAGKAEAERRFGKPKTS
ncbi:hypothetical protein [Amycolatopsis sp. NPDC049159]|uniref:hypothetical protein n=1 Tax=Amycolatopsis sp. NPDC049159 TaxID=3157210 RepID=UPI0033E9A34B